jgi:hypothetical protein
MPSARYLRLLAAMPLAISLLSLTAGCYAERRPRWDRYQSARRDDGRSSVDGEKRP